VFQNSRCNDICLANGFEDLSHALQTRASKGAILEDRFLSPPTIEVLAREVGTNSTQLKSGFRFFYHCSVYRYVSLFRISKACELLHDVNMSIAEVAEQSGYEHQSHFTTAFKKLCGASPLEYRKKVVETMKSL
jgi:AraC-like DNA-binding protein